MPNLHPDKTTLKGAPRCAARCEAPEDRLDVPQTPIEGAGIDDDAEIEAKLARVEAMLDPGERVEQTRRVEVPKCWDDEDEEGVVTESDRQAWAAQMAARAAEAIKTIKNPSSNPEQVRSASGVLRSAMTWGESTPELNGLLIAARKVLNDPSCDPDQVQKACAVLHITDGRVNGIDVDRAHRLGIREIAPEHATTPGVDYLVDGLIVRRESGLFAAWFKTGKTTFVATLVEALLLGKPFLGRATHLRDDEDILWLTEESRELFETRLTREFGLPVELVRQRIVVVYRRELRDVEWKAYISELAKAMKERAKRTGRRIGFVIVDSLHKWTGFEGNEESETGAGREAFEPLEHLMQATGAAAWFLHHATKKGGEFGAGISGTHAFGAEADVIVEMGRVGRSETQRALHVYGRRSGWNTRTDFRDGRYVSVSENGAGKADTGKPAKTIRPKTLKDRETIEAHVSAHGSAGFNELGRLIGREGGSLRAILKGLLAEKRLDQDPTTRQYIPGPALRAEPEASEDKLVQ